MNALMTACALGQVDAVKLLLSLGANKNACDSAGRSVLHHACQCMRSTAVGGSSGISAVPPTVVDVVKCLVAVGVDVSVVDGKRRTALHYAAEQGFVTVVDVLRLVYPAALACDDSNGKTPAQLARDKGFVDIAHSIDVSPRRPPVRAPWNAGGPSWQFLCVLCLCVCVSVWAVVRAQAAQRLVGAGSPLSPLRPTGVFFTTDDRIPSPSTWIAVRAACDRVPLTDLLAG